MASEARLAPVGEHLGRLRDAAVEVFKVLWPGQAVLETTLRLAKWLAVAPGRINEWRESAARAGAEMALSFVLSWYDEVRLDQLATRRAGAAATEPFLEELHARACAIASYAPVDEYIPPIDDEEDEASEGDEGDDEEGDGSGDGEE